MREDDTAASGKVVFLAQRSHAPRSSVRADRLRRIAELLGRSVDSLAGASPAGAADVAGPSDEQIRRLTAAFARLRDPDLRENLVGLVEEFAADRAPDPNQDSREDRPPDTPKG